MTSPAGAPPIKRRVVALAIAAAVGIPAAAASVSAAIERLLPVAAAKLSRGNVGAINRLAAVRMVEAPKISPADRKAARELLDRSLTASLVNPAALRLMGVAVNDSLEGEGLRPWMQAASSMSHRDTATFIWLAQDAARRRDVGGTIDYVDYALRSSFAAGETLTPVLVSGLADPAFRRRIPELVRDKVFWTSRFLESAVYQSKQPDVVAELVAASGGFPEAAKETERVLFGRLVAEGYYEDALKFARFMDEKAGDTARRIEITELTTNAQIAPIAWQVNPDVASVILLDDGRPGFVGQVARDRSSPIANKLVYSPPSRMRVTGTVRFAQRSPTDTLLIEAACPSASGTPFRAVGKPVAATTTGEQRWSREISLACNPVAIRLSSSSSLDGTGNELTISGLALTP